MTDVASTGVAELPRASTAHVPAAFERYTVVSLIAPTLIAGLLVAFDDPAPHVSTFVVWAVLVVLWNLQLALLARARLLPRRRWTAAWAPPWATGRAAAVVGLALAAGLLVHGTVAGRPVWLWSLPYAVTLADALLAHAPRARVRTHGRTVPAAPRATAVTLAAALAATAAPVVTVALLGRTAEALVPLGTAVLVGLLQVGQVWWLDVALELEASRTTSVALTRTEERLRFAGELHDLQGAELQNIVTQADLAQALLRRGRQDDVVRAAEAVAAIHAAAAGALRQTREIAHGYRVVDLAQEIEGARGILAAADIMLDVVGRPSTVPEPARRLTGLMVREGTTNILRHSATRTATLTIAQHDDDVTVTLLDPGPPRPNDPEGLPTGSGLASLAERASRAGMHLEHGPAQDGWHLTLRIPRSPTP